MDFLFCTADAIRRRWIGRLNWDAEGLMTLHEASERYCTAVGRDSLPDLSWYFAYNVFRMVGILQGIRKRVAAGNASSSEADIMIAKIGPLAREAWRQARMAGAPN